MRRSLNALSLCVCLSTLPSVATAALFAIDELSQTLPPNPCLPATLRPVLFKGSYCDGASCPPGTIVSNCFQSEVAGQMGLSSTMQNASQTVWRVAKVDVNSTSGSTATGEIRTDLARWQVSGNDPLGSLSYLRYGAAGWNLDFLSMGVLSIKVLVEGDVSPTRPLHCTVQLLDRDVAFRYGSRTVVVTAPGVVDFAANSFFTTGGFDFTGIDDINFSFTDCAFGYCSPPVSGARSYAVGPPALEVPDPTAAKHSTWGQIKQIYR